MTPGPAARTERGGRSVVLPDLLGARGEALLALGRTEEAWEALSEARDIAERHGSRRSLWRIYFEMSEVASAEKRFDESQKLRQQSRDLIDYIADHCGKPEIRDGFLNTPKVRQALAAE